MKKVLLILVGVTLLLIGIMVGTTKPLTQDQNQDVTVGSWDENTYHNDYFDLELRLPGAWVYNNDSLESEINEAFSKDKNLKYLTSAMGKNKAFVAFAYKLPLITARLNKEDDMRSLRKALKKQSLNFFSDLDDIDFELQPDITNKNGVKFIPATFEQNQGKYNFVGKILFTRKKEYIVVFFMMGIGNTEKIMEDITDSISFE